MVGSTRDSVRAAEQAGVSKVAEYQRSTFSKQ
jgi:hypothetical protein